MSTDLILTLLGIIICALIATFSFKQHFKERDTLKAPLISWMVVSMLAIAMGFMCVVHLANLMGFETGNR